eukprot:1184101-Prorocentrum_minimum.AAC.1
MAERPEVSAGGVDAGAVLGAHGPRSGAPPRAALRRTLILESEVHRQAGGALQRPAPSRVVMHGCFR